MTDPGPGDRGGGSAHRATVARRAVMTVTVTPGPPGRRRGAPRRWLLVLSDGPAARPTLTVTVRAARADRDSQPLTRSQESESESGGGQARLSRIKTICRHCDVTVTVTAPASHGGQSR